MWNPFLELLFLEQTSGVIVLYVEEIDLAQIALSCHFALDLLCYKEGGHDNYEWCLIGHHCLRIRVYHDVAPLSRWSLKPWALADWISSAAQSDCSTHESWHRWSLTQDGGFVPSLCCLASFLRWISTVYCSHLGHTLIRHQPADTLRGTHCVKCYRLESKMLAFVPLKDIAMCTIAAQHMQVNACQSPVFVSSQRIKNESVGFQEAWKGAQDCCWILAGQGLRELPISSRVAGTWNKAV